MSVYSNFISCVLECVVGEGEREGGKVIERESHNLIMPQKAGRNGKTIFWLRHSASSWSNVRGVCVLHELLQLEGMRWKSIVKSMKTIFTAGLWRGEAFFFTSRGKRAFTSQRFLHVSTTRRYATWRAQRSLPVRTILVSAVSLLN